MKKEPANAPTGNTAPNFVFSIVDKTGHKVPASTQKNNKNPNPSSYYALRSSQKEGLKEKIPGKYNKYKD